MASSHNTETHGVSARPRLRLSKLTPPVCPPWTIARDRLAAESRLFPAAKLIVVRAPAGFGKTTLLLQWHARLMQNGMPVAWLDLDDADNDPARFMCYLATALGQIAPEVLADPSVSHFLAHPNTSLATLTTHLIDLLAALEKPFVLFLDDFEHVTDARVLDVVRRLAERLPMQQQLVIASRGIPEIGFSRLLVRGLALEFTASALRFSEEETRQFLKGKHGIALSDAEMKMLQQGTEGWPAALHLATLSLDGREGAAPFLSNLIGCNPDITQYLAEDVLSRQPEDIRNFLLQTCILSQLSPSLCDSVTGHRDSAMLLDRIEKSNLFLTPLNPERSWYRYHALFADFLKTHLRRIGTFSEAGLHRRAAAWHVERRQWISALEHALACEDQDYAARVMELASNETLRAGGMDTITRWVESLPAAVLASHPGLEIDYIWALLFQYRYNESYARMERFTRETHDLDASQASRLDDLKAMRVILLGFTDRFEEAYRMGSEVLPAISSGGAFDRGIIASTMLYTTIAASRFDEIKDLLDIAWQSHSRANSEVGKIHCEVLAGMAELSQGHLQAALGQFRKALGLANEVGPNSQGAVATIVYLTDVLYEMNQLAECERRLLDNLPHVHESGMPDMFIQSHRTLMLISRARGDMDAADKWAAELERLGRQRDFARVVASAQLLRAELKLHMGDFGDAEKLLERALDSLDWERFEDWRPYANDIVMPDVVRLRLALARGHHDKAVALVAPMVEKAEQLRCHHRALTLRALWAKAIAQSAGEEAAARTLADVAPAAIKEGYCRTFIDEGDLVLRLLRRLNCELSRLPVTERRSATATPASPLLDEFSDREIQVLHLVAQGLSNRAIAERLFISETTVKFHLRNINLKTDARSRTHAVAIGRSLGLIE